VFYKKHFCVAANDTLLQFFIMSFVMSLSEKKQE